MNKEHAMHIFSKRVLLAVALAITQAAHAHTDEYLDTVAAPHGGQLRMTGPYHYELVVKNNELTVYLTDHGGTNVASAGAKGSATILSSKGKTRIQLAPAGENVMRGSGQFEAAPDMKVAVSITLPGQDAALARFTPFRKLTAH
jgi:hypothetical protein